MMTMTEEQATFEQLRQTPPVVGSVLVSLTGSPTRVSEDFTNTPQGRKRIVFVKCIVDTARKGWFLHEGSVGMVCLILPRSQRMLRRNSEGVLLVDSLKVVGVTSNGKALLCEVKE